MRNMLWGLATADELTAYAAAATALITLVLLIYAHRQIKLVQYENRKTATIAACTHYDLSENIYAATVDLWRAGESGALKRSPRKYRPQISVVLNHLDAIAIGVKQGIYIEDLAWDHLHAIVARHVKSYIDTGICEQAGLKKEDYRTLIDLRDEWSRARPRFSDGGRVESSDWRVICPALSANDCASVRGVSQAASLT